MSQQSAVPQRAPVDDPLPEATWLPWVRLWLASGVGRVRANRLLEAFESPEEVFRRTAEEIAEAAECPASVAEGLVAPANADEARSELARLRKLGVRLTRLGAPDYPALLAEMHYPPILLGRLGTLADPGRKVIAIVGSRQAGARALRVAYEFARASAAAGVVVVSGLAKGVDRAAHEGALAVAGGQTIAVSGCGLARVYPYEHRPLAARIRERGALLSEFAADAPPHPQHFPLRNRIIAGLARATVVIAAGKRSGALITARHAVEECASAREVFAIPGSIDDALSHGTNKLIKDGGAHLVESPGEMLEQLGWQKPQPDAPAARAVPDRVATPLTGVSADIVRFLEAEARICTFDEIVFGNRIDARAAMSALGFLAVRQRVREIPGVGYEAVG